MWPRQNQSDFHSTPHLVSASERSCNSQLYFAFHVLPVLTFFLFVERENYLCFEELYVSLQPLHPGLIDWLLGDVTGADRLLRGPGLFSLWGPQRTTRLNGCDRLITC